MLTGLTEIISRLQPVSRIRAGSGRTRVFGVPAAARPALTGALILDMLGPILAVAAHPQAAQDLADELGQWTDRRVALFPAIEALPYERVRLDRELLAAREAVHTDLLGGNVDIVVAPIRALLQPVPGGSDDAGQPSTVRAGAPVALDRLITTWVEAGYAEVGMVDEPGTFARRGGVLDVFPAGAEQPVRIELFGSEVESLRAFDPATQRSTQSVSSVTVPPIARLDEEARLGALEALLEVDTSTMTSEAGTRWNDDLGRLEAGAALDDLTLFAPYLIAAPASLIDCLPASGSVVVDSAQETWDVMRDLWDQAVEVQRGMEDSGELPRGLKPALLSPQQIAESLLGVRCIEWMAGSDARDGDEDWSGLFAPAHTYAGRLRSFVQDMSTGTGGRTVIASQQHERVAELLREEGIPIAHVALLAAPPDAAITLVRSSIKEGWSLPHQRLAVLSDHELFGTARVRQIPRRKRAPRESFLVDFTPGDYVVHLEHGIGRFEGVTRMAVEAAERDYAIVQYAGSDRVYVPTDQLERLTRYVGVGDSPPHLNRLGGGEWLRARHRAREAAEDIARELLDIYSKRQARPGRSFAPDTPWQRELESSFPYPETPDQLQAVGEVKADMEAPSPMDRLVCADVGYGKTEVAVRAAFKAIMDGQQVGVLVPTTVLAQQHYETFAERFAAFPVKVEVLSRFRSPAEQRQVLKGLATGEVDVVIGTHRLLQKDVSFKNLGLLVVDEEQRFGVKHKEQLKKLRETVDVLTLTATPIPRTLHMTLVGIREVSVIETPPEGRLPIRTYLQPYDDRLVREAVLRELDRDGQVYVVHNRVATIEAMAERVRRLVPEARVVVGHGQMDERQLEKTMLTFAHHEADVLICSTIIENGLDIPNVNTILVNNAHRLGLTQLYQLRGRVGRSANQAYAYLLYPQDVRLSHDAARRMEAIFEAQDLGAGFTIAMKDLEIRGAGNLLGAEQSGHASAVGFDLYTRMVAEAVERLRGVPVQEPPLVSVDLPLTAFIPADYVPQEAERLTLYRRLASVSREEGLSDLAEEMRDRFGPLPPPLENLLRSVHLKLIAADARVTSVSLGADHLVVRTAPGGLFDRVSLYRRFGMEARISTNVLRIPRHLLGREWPQDIEEILRDMARLRAAASAGASTAPAGDTTTYAEAAKS